MQHAEAVQRGVVLVDAAVPAFAVQGVHFFAVAQRGAFRFDLGRFAGLQSFSGAGEGFRRLG